MGDRQCLLAWAHPIVLVQFELFLLYLENQTTGNGQVLGVPCRALHQHPTTGGNTLGAPAQARHQDPHTLAGGLQRGCCQRSPGSSEPPGQADSNEQTESRQEHRGAGTRWAVAGGGSEPGERAHRLKAGGRVSAVVTGRKRASRPRWGLGEVLAEEMVGCRGFAGSQSLGDRISPGRCGCRPEGG